jgi:hypothetical protein
LCGLLRLGNQQIDERQKRLLGKGILLASNVTIYPSDCSFKEFVEAILAGHFNSDHDRKAAISANTELDCRSKKSHP